MKLSLDWLGDYIEFTETDPQKISDAITSHSAEVDEVETQGSLLENCCVGMVTNLQKHPDADKLQTCIVKTDKGDKPIVCGGTNLEEGMCVAFAHVGAKVQTPDGELFELTKIKIRGEQSEGMICAAEELALESMYPPKESDGKRPVINLGDVQDAVGTSLREFLGLTDVILHIDNHAITHRPDLFSHIGFARECVAIGIATWKKFDASKIAGIDESASMPTFTAPEFTSDPVAFSMNVEDQSLMPRYCACTLDIDEVGTTPDWMKRRLIATGWRSINPAIDITNYVMMEVGLPLHSFDADDIDTSISMRRANKGEKIITLDQAERELSEGALILEDNEGIFDLLGIMGGLRSSTKDSTKKIYLHGASLDPVSIRHAMINMGHRTDAGTTYEKSVPHYTTEQGFYRTLQLFLDIVPGAKITSKLESIGENGNPEPIDLHIPKAQKHLGKEIPHEIIVSILKDLGFTVEGSGDDLSVTPPLWRLKDVTGAHDLYEEIGRIYGYDNIEAIMPYASISPPKRETRIHAIRDFLKIVGYKELMPFSLVGPELISKCGFDPENCVEILDPIGEEMSLMAPSVLPRLLEHADQYLRHSTLSLKTFHIGHVFAKGDEHEELGMLITPKSDGDLKNSAFYQIKQDIVEGLEAANYKAAIEDIDATFTYAHPGRLAKISVDGTIVGQLFEVHPQVRKKFGIQTECAAVLLCTDELLKKQSEERVASKLAQFPAVEYDETITMTHQQSATTLQLKLLSASDLLEEITVSDLYSGQPLEDGSYNLTLHFVYRSEEKTLTEDEVKKEHDKVMATLQ